MSDTIRSVDDVIRVAEKRGFQILVNPGPPPMPILRGKKDEATPALLQALKAWRVEILERLAQDDTKRIEPAVEQSPITSTDPPP